MLVDHIAVAAADPDGWAASFAASVGATWHSLGATEDGYRSASVIVGDGLYLDVLTPDSSASSQPLPEDVVELLQRAADGSPVAWAIEVDDAVGVAHALEVRVESWPDEHGAPAYEMVGWSEALASGGVLPFFVRYGASMAGRRRRASELWADAPGHGVGGIVLRGSDADREALQRTLAVAAAACGVEAEPDVPLQWVPGRPALHRVDLRFDGSVVPLPA